MINLLHLTKEQKEFYWAEYEKAEREFEEICEDWENLLKLEEPNYEYDYEY